MDSNQDSDRALVSKYETVFCVILGLTDIALHDESLAQETKGDLERIHKSATLGKNMVSNFVGLAKKERFTLAPCRIEEIVLPVLSPLEAALEQNEIKLVLALDADLPPVMGSQIHLQRLLLNSPAGKRKNCAAIRRKWSMYETEDPDS